MTLRTCPPRRRVYFTMRFPITIYDNACLSRIDFLPGDVGDQRSRTTATRGLIMLITVTPCPRCVKYLVRRDAIAPYFFRAFFALENPGRDLGATPRVHRDNTIRSTRWSANKSKNPTVLRVCKNDYPMSSYEEPFKKMFIIKYSEHIKESETWSCLILQVILRILQSFSKHHVQVILVTNVGSIEQL